MAAYAVIIRDEQILLSRLAPHVSRDELWTLPGGGLDHGEDPRDAVVREVHEETGLHAARSARRRTRLLAAPARHLARGPAGRRALAADRLRRLGAGRLAAAPGASRSTARPWRPPGSRSPDVLDGSVPTVALVTRRWPRTGRIRMQRVAAYALVGARRRGAADPELAARPPPRPVDAARRRHRPRRGAAPTRGARGARGVRAGVRGRRAASTVDDDHFRGTAPSGRDEDFHAVRLVFDATVPPDAEPRVVEVDGTTDAVAWVPVADVESRRDVLDVVRHALRRADARRLGCAHERDRLHLRARRR